MRGFQDRPHGHILLAKHRNEYTYHFSMNDGFRQNEYCRQNCQNVKLSICN